MTISVDSINITLQEKAVSQDQNDQTTLPGRSVVEAISALNSLPNLKFNAFGESVTASIVQQKVGGLPIINVLASSITLGPGVLMTDDGAEDPTAIDSSYRIGLQTEQIEVPVTPLVVSGRWHVLEAQVVQTIVQADRDILVNPATNEFSEFPVDKQLLKRLAFRTREATADGVLPVVTPDWTPLYVFPLTGTAPDEGTMVDVRQPAGVSALPRTSQFSADFFPISRRLETQAVAQGPDSLLIFFNFSAVIRGNFCFAYTDVGTFTDARDYLEQGITEFAPTDEGDWFYIYMAPSPYDAGPSIANLYDDDVTSNCVIVISPTPPTRDLRNSGTLNLPSPFENENLTVGSAVLMGILKGPTEDVQPAQFASFVPLSTSDGGETRIASTRPIRVVSLEAENAMEIDLRVSEAVGAAHFLPVGPRTVTYAFGNPNVGSIEPEGFIQCVPASVADPDDFGIGEDYGRVAVRTQVQNEWTSLTTISSVELNSDNDPVPNIRLQASDARGVPGATTFVDITSVGYVFAIRLLGFNL